MQTASRLHVLLLLTATWLANGGSLVLLPLHASATCSHAIAITLCLSHLAMSLMLPPADPSAAGGLAYTASPAQPHAAMTAYTPMMNDSGKPHIKLSDYMADPTTLDGIQLYLDTEAMEKPIIFMKTDKFVSYFCCLAWTSAFASIGMTCACPVALCCPGKIAGQYMLKVGVLCTACTPALWAALWVSSSPPSCFRALMVDRRSFCV
jgi:hypothetical protein